MILYLFVISTPGATEDFDALNRPWVSLDLYRGENDTAFLSYGNKFCQSSISLLACLFVSEGQGSKFRRKLLPKLLLAHNPQHRLDQQIPVGEQAEITKITKHVEDTTSLLTSSFSSDGLISSISTCATDSCKNNRKILG